MTIRALRVTGILAVAVIACCASACQQARLDNCADPAYSCDASTSPPPVPGSRIINDFEATAQMGNGPLGCTSLFAGEHCALPLKNLLGQCADSLFCAYGGSSCAAPVTGVDAFRGRQSWRIRFNESAAVDASTAALSANGDPPDAGVGDPFSGYSERLSSVLAQGTGCDGSQPPFDASAFTHLTFWMKAEDDVDFEIGIKSDRPTGATYYAETFPKVALGDCQTWSPSCICGTYNEWHKVCLPLPKLQPATAPDTHYETQVNLSRLIEINFAFAANPYVTFRHKRGAAEITIDDLGFER